MEPTTLLKEYGAAVGLPALAFDAHGCARLRFDSGADVNLEVDPSGDAIHLYTVLGLVPPGPKERLFQRLLEANAFGTDTCGACLSIDAARNEFILCKRCGDEMRDAADFAAAISGFAEAARNWVGSLAELDPSGAGDGQASQPGAFNPMTHLRA
jgi:hypothetical protein